jgi:hypothetical protein
MNCAHIFEAARLATIKNVYQSCVIPRNAERFMQAPSASLKLYVYLAIRPIQINIELN